MKYFVSRFFSLIWDLFFFGGKLHDILWQRSRCSNRQIENIFGTWLLTSIVFIHLPSFWSPYRRVEAKFRCVLLYKFIFLFEMFNSLIVERDPWRSHRGGLWSRLELLLGVALRGHAIEHFVPQLLDVFLLVLYILLCWFHEVVEAFLRLFLWSSFPWGTNFWWESAMPLVIYNFFETVEPKFFGGFAHLYQAFDICDLRLDLKYGFQGCSPRIIMLSVCRKCILLSIVWIIQSLDSFFFN